MWKVLKAKSIIERMPWFKVWVETIKLPDGRVVDEYFQIDQPEYVEIFALVDPEHAVGLWRYKHGPRKVNLGLPAGYIEPFELPLAAAQRELLEETGYKADDWKCLGVFSIDGNRGFGKAHIYLARDLHKVAEPDPDDLEDAQIQIVTLDIMKQRLLSGEVATLGVAAAISMAFLSNSE